MKVVICCFLWCLVYASQCMATDHYFQLTISAPIYLTCDKACFYNGGSLKMDSSDKTTIKNPTDDLPPNTLALPAKVVLSNIHGSYKVKRISGFYQQIYPNGNETQISLYPLSTKAGVGNKQVTIKLRISGFQVSIKNYFFGLCPRGLVGPTNADFVGYTKYISQSLRNIPVIDYKNNPEYPIPEPNTLEVRSKGPAFTIIKTGTGHYNSGCTKDPYIIYDTYRLEKLYLSSDVITNTISASKTDWKNTQKITFKFLPLHVSKLANQLGYDRQLYDVRDYYYVNIVIPINKLVLKFTGWQQVTAGFGRNVSKNTPVTAKNVTLTKEKFFSNDMSAIVPFYVVSNSDAPLTVTMHCDKNAKGQCVLKEGNTNAPYNIYMKMRSFSVDPNRALVSDQPMTINHVKSNQPELGSFVLKAKNIINAKNAGKRLTGTVTFAFSIPP